MLKADRPAPVSSTATDRRAWVPYLFIAPFFVFFALFWMFPFLFTVFSALTNWAGVDNLNPVRFTGWSNFDYYLQDERFLGALRRSFTGALQTSLWQHLFAIPLAFLLTVGFKRWKSWVSAIYFLPYITAPLAIFFLYRSFNEQLVQFSVQMAETITRIPVVGVHLQSWVFQNIFTLLNILPDIWQYIGWNVLLYLMIMSTIPKSLFEASRLDGITLWQQLRFIVFPLIRPMVFFALSMSFLQQLGFFDTQGSSISSFIQRTSAFNGDFGGGSAMNLMLFGCMMLFIGVAYLLFGRGASSIELSWQMEGKAKDHPFKPYARVILGMFLLLGCVLSIVPFLQTFFWATQTDGEFYRVPPLFGVGSNTAANFQDLKDNIPLLRSLWNTLYLAGVATLGTLLVSNLAGYAFAHHQFKYKNLLFAVVMFSMLFPPTVNAIPTAILMNTLGWAGDPRSLWVPALVSGFSVFLMRQYIQASIPKETLEAARVDGAGEWMIFWRIIFPLSAPVLTVLALILFANHWNSFSLALATFRNTEEYVIQQAVRSLERMDGTHKGTLYMGISISTLFPLALYILSLKSLMLFTGGDLRSRVPKFASTPEDEAGQEETSQKGGPG
ncbi:ABC transporter permease subunit [Deinococcus misasensis]|uniref:ABC transporter permease n=1 Tax=Deinococcus misasensis TaxID=392413 RepID=UPI00068A879F|nr:ABC transporter permease subunit [Deinococcus misasensis]